MLYSSWRKKPEIKKLEKVPKWKKILSDSVRRVVCGGLCAAGFLNLRWCIVAVAMPVASISYMSESEQQLSSVCFLQTQVWHFVGVLSGEWECQSLKCRWNTTDCYCFVVPEGKRVRTFPGKLSSDAHRRKCGEWCEMAWAVLRSAFLPSRHCWPMRFAKGLCSKRNWSSSLSS